MENLITLILSMIVVSTFCLGYRAITSEGKILYFLRAPFEKISGGWKAYLMNPLILCVTCMPSIWGTLTYLTINHFDALWLWEFGLMGLQDWLFLVICVVSSSFLSGYWWSKYE